MLSSQDQQTPVIEPVDPFQGYEFHRLQASPGAPRANHLGLVQPDDRLGQGVIVRIANTAHRLPDAGLGQAVDVADRETAIRDRCHGLEIIGNRLPAGVEAAYHRQSEHTADAA